MLKSLRKNTGLLEMAANPAICSGTGGLVGPALFQYWATHDCPSAYAALLNSSPVPIGEVVSLNCSGTGGAGNCAGSTTCLGSTFQNGATVTVNVPCTTLTTKALMQEYNPRMLPLVQNYLSDLFIAYNKTNAITNNRTDPQYNPFQEELLQTCLDPRLPGACQPYLSGYCSAYSSLGELNPTTVDFCGCFVPNPYPEIPNGCAPGCNRPQTVRKSDPATGQLEKCSPDVCVIDNVTISLTNSEVSGGVNFVNFCPGCGGGTEGGCFCLIAGVDVTETFSSIGLGTSFSQYCGPGSVCLQGTAPHLVSVSCQNAAAASATGGTSSVFPWKWIILVSLVVTLFVLGVWAGR